jgi:hypothetical protein
MKRANEAKVTLSLRREALRELTAADLREVAGASQKCMGPRPL